MHPLDQYYFDDCLFVDMKWSSQAEGVIFLVEAYPPCETGEMGREKQLIHILCKQPVHIDMELAETYWSDVALRYDFDGGDQRANEIESLTVGIENGRHMLHIRSDYLKAIVISESIEVSKGEVPK